MVYGFEILREFVKGTFKISPKILNLYTAKYAFTDFMCVCVIYDVFELWRSNLSETIPWTAKIRNINWLKLCGTTWISMYLAGEFDGVISFPVCSLFTVYFRNVICHQI